MDASRVLSVGLGVVAYGLCILALAVAPGFMVSGGPDPAGFAKLAPALGGASGMAVRGYAIHHRPGTRNGLRWALVQGGLMLLVILAMFALATVVNPIVSSDARLGGDVWLGLMAVGAVIAMACTVLWERSQRRRRIAGIGLVAVCLIIVGLIGLRAAGPWTLIGTPFLVVGVFAFVAVVVQGASEVVRATGDPAT